MAQGTLAAALDAMASALDVLADDLTSTETARALLASLGVVTETVPTALLDLGPLLADVTERASNLRGASGAGGPLVAAVELSTALAALSRAMVGTGVRHCPPSCRRSRTGSTPTRSEGSCSTGSRSITSHATPGRCTSCSAPSAASRTGSNRSTASPTRGARQDDDPLGPETDHFDGREAPSTSRRRTRRPRVGAAWRSTGSPASPTTSPGR